MASTRAHALIEGKVQGVWFRESTKQEALKQGLAGWVRNLPDGRVEALLEGEEAGVGALLAWCQHGPEAARVDKVEVNRQTATGEFHDFVVLR